MILPFVAPPDADFQPAGDLTRRAFLTRIEECRRRALRGLDGFDDRTQAPDYLFYVRRWRERVAYLATLDGPMVTAAYTACREIYDNLVAVQGPPASELQGAFDLAGADGGAENMDALLMRDQVAAFDHALFDWDARRYDDAGNVIRGNDGRITQ